MIIYDGDYAWKFWQIGFLESPLEVAAAIRKPKGRDTWCVRGRIRVRHDELNPDGSQDIKLWFESPHFATKEEAHDAWTERLAGFIEESRLAIREQHEVLLESSDEREIVTRLEKEGIVQASANTARNPEQSESKRQLLN